MTENESFSGAPDRDANRISVSFKRHDFCLLLDALDSIIEYFKYDGGLVLAEDYIRIENRLRQRLTSHDSATTKVVRS